jgi:adenosylcobinamide hydrolase
LTTRIGIAGLNLKIDDKTLIIKSRRQLHVLSSAVLNGGLTTSRVIINHHVPKGVHILRPERYLKEFLRKRDLEPNSIGLMTAADIRNVSIVNHTKSEPRLSVVVTAGVSNAMAAGDDATHFQEKPGTINMILVLDGNPTDGCLIEIVKTATEAKGLALRELDILSRASNRTATGTSTDTVTIASTCRGEPIKYAGTATVLGSTISRHVIRAVKEAVRKQDGISQDRLLVQRLKDRGITSKQLTKIVSRRVSSRLPLKSKRQFLPKMESQVHRVLQKPDVSSVILASLKMCEDASTSRNSIRMARGAGASIAYLIGGELGRSEFLKTSSNWRRTLSGLVMEGILSGLVAEAIKSTRPEG